MAKKNNLDFSTTSYEFLSKEINEWLKEIAKEVDVDKEAALTEATIYVKSKLEEKSQQHRVTGELARSWINTGEEYNGVRYINNTALTKKGIPKLNLLEFSIHKGKPFVRDTLAQSKNEVIRIFEKHLKE
jgi:hypothetical protein